MHPHGHKVQQKLYIAFFSQKPNVQATTDRPQTNPVDPGQAPTSHKQSNEKKGRCTQITIKRMFILN